MRSITILALGTAVLLGSGCSGRNSDIDSWVEQVKSKPAGAIDPIPPSPDYDEFSYEAHSLRDPFTAFRRAADPSQFQGPKPDPNRPREPLEEFAMDGLKMVGTLRGGAQMQALIMDPNGVTHRLGTGQRMGQNDGRIISVEPSRVVLVELVSNGMGGWEETQAIINLSETD